jgi:hypothetical protein
MAIPHHSDLHQLQHLIRRDRQRKLIALLVLSGLTGALIYAQSAWVLAVLATGMAGGTAWQRRRLRAQQLSDPGVKQP